jgi:hypothetical protein
MAGIMTDERFQAWRVKRKTRKRETGKTGGPVGEAGDV